MVATILLMFAVGILTYYFFLSVGNNQISSIVFVVITGFAILGLWTLYEISLQAKIARMEALRKQQEEEESSKMIERLQVVSRWHHMSHPPRKTRKE